MQFPALATAASVTLAWNSSTDSTIAGYNIYYGGASHIYTNKISVGKATSVTISGLVQGTTYYFAATTYSASGVESEFSSELAYLVPANVPIANQPPTLNAINDLTITENTGLQTVSLSDITSGATTENQTLTVTAVSSDTSLIPNPSVNYTSANTTGSLTFTPVHNADGTAIITVTVNDGQARNNTVIRTFTVTVVADSVHQLAHQTIDQPGGHGGSNQYLQRNRHQKRFELPMEIQRHQPDFGNWSGVDVKQNYHESSRHIFGDGVRR